MAVQARTSSLKPISSSFKSTYTGDISNIKELLKKSTVNINEETMGRNENQTKSMYNSYTTHLQPKQDADITIVFNAISTSMIEFGIRHRKFIKKAYDYFAELCGYKSNNQLYSIFAQRPGYDLKLKDAKKIYDETGDERILEAIITYFKMKEN